MLLRGLSLLVGLSGLAIGKLGRLKKSAMLRDGGISRPFCTDFFLHSGEILFAAAYSSRSDTTGDAR